MELKYLVTVKKVIETGSYQKAAAALNYAQSTITFQIRQLEQEFGAQLFERSGGTMALTQAGKELLPWIDQVLGSVDALHTYCRQRDGLQGALTIAAPESLVTYQLQAVLGRFKEKAPNVKLRLKCMNCFAIHDMLCGSGVDIAIHYDVGTYPKSVAVAPLRSFSLVLIGSPRLSAGERDFITQGQVKQLCNIQNDPDATSLKMFQQYMREKSIHLENSLEVWSIEAIKRSVMSNLGIAFLPRFTVESELHSGELIELPTDIEKPEMTAICAYQKGRWKSPAMELFLQILSEEFSPDGSE